MTQINPNKKAYDINSFAEAYSIGRTKVYEEIGSKRLRATKLGRRTLIAVEDAEAWFASLKKDRSAMA